MGVRFMPDDGSGQIEYFAIHLDGTRCRFRC